MNSDFTTTDIIVFASYALIILSVGLWVSRNKKGKTKSAEDYFLASKSLIALSLNNFPFFKSIAMI